MMRNRLYAIAVLAVICSACLAGGPRSINGSLLQALVGSIPSDPPCNADTSGLNDCSGDNCNLTYSHSYQVGDGTYYCVNETVCIANGCNTKTACQGTTQGCLGPAR